MTTTLRLPSALRRPRRSAARRTLRVESLEARVAPATDFQITSLTGNNVTTVQHDAVTNDDFGGIALSNSQAFVTGNSATGRFSLSNLSGGTSTGFRYDAISSDLKTQKVYAFGSEVLPDLVVPITWTGGLVTHLMEIDGATGNRTFNDVPLSTSISFGIGMGIFAGYERIVLHQLGSTVYEIALPSGAVTVLNQDLDAEPARASNNGSGWYWGTAEHFGGEDYLDYATDTQVITRRRVSDGAFSPLAVLSNIADMASFTVSPATGRWYFHHEGPSQFRPGAAQSDEVVGFADATFQIGSLVVTNLNDAGPGSLRGVIGQANADPGQDVISFFPGLTGAINLTSPIAVTETVELAGPGSGVITIAGTGSNMLFQDGSASGMMLTVHGLTLSNPNGVNVPYSLSATGDTVITAGTGNVVFTGVLAVSGGLTLMDGNAVELGAFTTLNSGTIAAANGVVVGVGDTLSGAGNVTGAVTIQSGGKIAPAGSIGTFNLVVATGGTIEVGLHAPGVNDRLVVTGTVNIGAGAAFAPTLTYAPLLTDSFLVIDNNLFDPIAGQLNGARNRSGLSIDGFLFQVRYDGGTGNDVQLLMNDAPVLNTAAATHLPTLLEDLPPSSNPGTSVDALVATDGLYTDAEGLFRSGIAVTGFGGANGVWQLSRNGGGTWTDFPAVSATSAMLLEADGTGQNRVRFLPNANVFGSATLSFKGWDTTDGQADGTTGANVFVGGGNFAWSAATESAVVEVLAVNDAPVAAADEYSVAEDGALSPPDGVLDNDTDVDGPLPLTATLLTGPAHGTLVLNSNGSFTYTPAANYNGPDAFTYRVTDGTGLFDIGVVALTVTSVNDNPTANADTASSPEDGGAVTIDVLANDSIAPDAGELLTITGVGTPFHGSATIATDGKSVHYIPGGNYAGADSFTYTISDGRGGAATATVNVTVQSVNDLPDAADDVATLIEDGGPQSIDVLANDTGIPDAGETLTVGSVTQGAHGTVAIAADGLSVLYTPHADYAGPDAFFYSITDGNGGSDFAAVTVTVGNDAADRLEVITTPITATFTENDEPVIVDTGVRVGSALEGVITSATVRFVGGYVKGKDKLVFAASGAIRGTFAAATGTLTLSGAASSAAYQAALQSVKYTNTSPAPVDGVRTLAFQVKDAAGTGDAATKILRVAGVNTKPTVTLLGPALTYRRGKPGVAVAGTLKVTDIDNTRLQSAQVSITAGFAANLDLLKVVPKPGIVPNYIAATGVLTLTGNATIATYLAVLKSLKFSTAATAPTGPRTLMLTVNDGLLNSDPVTRMVNVI